MHSMAGQLERGGQESLRAIRFSPKEQPIEDKGSDDTVSDQCKVEEEEDKEPDRMF